MAELKEYIWDLDEESFCITHLETFQLLLNQGNSIIIKNINSEFLDWLRKGIKYESELKELNEKLDRLLTLIKGIGGTDA